MENLRRPQEPNESPTASETEVPDVEKNKERERILEPDLTSKESETTESPKTFKPEELEKFKGSVLHVDVSSVVNARARREAEQKKDELLRSDFKGRTWTGSGKESKLSKFYHEAKVNTENILAQAKYNLAEFKDLKKSNFLKRMYVRLGEKGYLSRLYKEARTEIKNNKNLLTEINPSTFSKTKVEIKAGTKDTSYEILDSIIDEYDKELTDADEKGEVVIDAGVNQAAGELFADFAAGRITSREDFDKEVDTRIVPLLKGRKFTSAAGRDKEAVGLMYANNFWELAKGFKDYVDKKVAEFGPEHRGEILEHIKGEMALDIQLGLKQRDLFETKPQETLKWYEKFVDKTQSIHLLNKIAANPITYGIVGGIAGTFAGRGIVRAGATAGLVGIVGVAPWLAPILAGMGFGGLFVAARRSRDLSYDRGMDLRRATLGAEVGGKRTEKMREFHYDQKKAEELIAGLKALSAKAELTPVDKDAIAKVISRLKVEKEQSVDLIGVETEAGSKYKTRAIGMKDLKWELKQVREKFGLTDNELQPLVDAWSVKFLGNIKATDEAFDKYRHKEMAKAGVMGAVMGLAAGALGQHVVHMIKGSGPESALQHLYHVIKGDTQDFPRAFHEVPIGIPGTHDSVPINIPEGASLSPAGDHSILLDHDGHKLMDVFVNKDGSLADRTLHEAADRGFQVQDHIETVTKTISPSDHFKDQLGEHARVDWHDELGRRFSNFFHKLIEFEGKQQMLYMEKDADGNVFVNAEGIAKNLINNVEGALKEFGTNPDGSVDSHLAHLHDQMLQAAKDGTLAKHLQLVIIPTEEANQHGTSILVEGANDQFQLAFPKEISDMISATPHGLEYGHHPFQLAEIRYDGHVLATTVGNDMPPIETSIPLHHPEIIPPVGHDWEAPPVWPFSPRYVLEAPGKKELPPPIYPYYGAGSGEAILEDFERRGIKLDPYEIAPAGKETLAIDSEGKPVRRDVERERTRIEKYIDSFESDYDDDVKNIADSLEPMHQKCRVAVIVPARFEEKNLANLLDQYSKQVDEKGKPINPDLYEINIIVNRKKSETPDKSIQAIDKWKKDHSNIHVNIIDKAFDDDKACVGLARKYVTDATLVRSVARKKVDEPLYIESEDADLSSVDKRTVSKLIKDFDSQPHLDVLRGKQDRQPEVMKENDLLFFQRRLWDFMEAFLRDPKYRPDKDPKADFVWHRVVSGGWNTAFTAEAYAQIGGYGGHYRIGEDMAIGQQISVLRGQKNKTSGEFIPNTWTARASGLRSNSSPRRFIDALARDITPYGDFDNQDLKSKTLKELLGEIKRYEKAGEKDYGKYQETLKIAADFLKQLDRGQEGYHWQDVLRRTLFYIGLKKDTHYTLRDNEVELTSKGMKRIIELLENYKKEQRWKLGYRQ